MHTNQKEEEGNTNLRFLFVFIRVHSWIINL
jgi:hypothetical protein